jgi:hypothetical protein
MSFWRLVRCSLIEMERTAPSIFNLDHSLYSRVLDNRLATIAADGGLTWANLHGHDRF